MKNWKTTVAGIIAGAIPILQGISGSMGQGVPIHWLPIVMGLAIMALGVLAKDFTEVAKVVVLGFAMSGLTACGGSLHSQIEKALVFEQQVHSYQTQLLTVAESAIVLLPAEKQAAAREALDDANAHLTAALDAKDAALQAALDASDTSNLNMAQLVTDIVAAVQAIVAVIDSFGASPQRTQYIGNALIAAQSRALSK